MNRGVEIATEVADLPNAVITAQVANGVAVRMAVLFLLLETGARAAAIGGYTCVVAMPNTEPTIDSVEVVRAISGWGDKALAQIEVDRGNYQRAPRRRAR